jgi:hypothetical protein
MRAGLFTIGCALGLIAQAPEALAQFNFQSVVGQIGQPNHYTCGPTTVAMWANALRRCSCVTPTSALGWMNANGCVVNANDGTNIPEFIRGISGLGPSGYSYAEFAYTCQTGLVKSIAAKVAQYQEPLAVSGIYGQHWFLVRGVTATANPNPSTSSSRISGFYLNDSKFQSPAYSSYYFSPNAVYAPSTFLSNVQAIGSLLDRRYRTVERANVCGTVPVSYCPSTY